MGPERFGFLDVPCGLSHQRGGLSPPVLDQAVGPGPSRFEERFLSDRCRCGLGGLNHAGDHRSYLSSSAICDGDDLRGATFGVDKERGCGFVNIGQNPSAGLDGSGPLPGVGFDLLCLKPGTLKHTLLGVESRDHGLVDLIILGVVLLGDGQARLDLFCPLFQLAEVGLDLSQEGLYFLLVVPLTDDRELALIQSIWKIR